MAGRSRGKPPQELQRPVKPAKKICFVNGDLIRLDRSVKSANITYFFNITQGKPQTMLYTDFKKYRKRAYSVASSAKILNRGTAQLHRYVQQGLIKPPTGSMLGGEQRFGVNAYYSEDDLFEIREAMTTVHRGKPRLDGGVTPSRVLTENELRARIGDALMLYTRTKDGRYVPTWAEETY